MSSKEMKVLNNEIIRASAGSGKTYELVRRYLTLLALDEPPESIAAMTFTRKAAREFFERILQKLAELAEHPDKAMGYVDGLEEEGRAVGLLRRMIDSMDRLRLGTIDSFFASVTRCFPFELGLSGMASVMDENESAGAREEVMQALLVELTRGEERQGMAEMLEAWKRATIGGELNAPSVHLSRWFESLHPYYLKRTEVGVWGGLKTIWPAQSAPVWLAAKEKVETLVAALRDRLDVTLYPANGEKRWVEFFEEAVVRRVGEPLKSSPAIEYMLNEGRGDMAALRLGDAEWKVFNRKPVILKAATALALANVLEVLIGRELICRSERTKGRWELVKRFDAWYARLVRGQGRLAFADLTWLLSGQVRAAVAEERRERLEELRREWEYRLDDRFKHWLFDEFQDTSRLQWEVMQGLVDEAASDPEGRRSFFVVGDLKQSLYVFRQAEPELFLEVEERYRNVRMGEGRSLATSYRSSPEVLAMVNEVFGKEELLRERFPAAMRWWSYETHLAAEAVAKKRGCGALLSVSAEVEDAKEAKLELVTALIAEIEPLKRGLSCAVLTRTNDEAQRVSAELRRRLQMEVVCESKVEAGVDNPLTLLLLSVLQLAVHPGDKLALEHVWMSPLRGWMELQGEKAGGVLGGEVRRGVSRFGFLVVLQTWADRVREGQGLTEWDAFTAMRLAQLLDVASGFDEDGRRDVDEFIDAGRSLTVSGLEQKGALQVMTFHKSKGLEFDVVIMPEIYRKALDDTSRGGAERLLVERDGHGVLQWVLDEPPAVLRDRDERLSAAYEQEKARLAYQSLCRLYVGMTRAKRGLYVILEPKAATDRSEDGLLRAALAEGDAKAEIWQVGDVNAETGAVVLADCWYQSGDRQWYEGEEWLREDQGGAGASGEAEAGNPMLGELLKAMTKPVSRKSPSGEEAFKISGRNLLSPQRERARKQGTLVHDLFSAVEWLGDATAGVGVKSKVKVKPQLELELELDLGLVSELPLGSDSGFEATLEADWQRRGWTAREGYEEAKPLVLRALADATVASWFRNPKGNREVWRERSFDWYGSEGWVSGVFDRVVFERDAKGDFLAAYVLDFKTDVVADEAAVREKAKGYRPQLKLYAQAVSRLTGLPVGQIRTGLIFVAAVVPRLEWVEV